MIPIPKPKFLERKVPGNYGEFNPGEFIPVGQSKDDYFEDIIDRQSHILSYAIDRVSYHLKFVVRNLNYFS